MSTLWLLASLALADVLPLPKSPATPCSEGLEMAILTLRLTGDRAAYECLADDDDAQGPLIAAMAEADAPAPERVSRALALWRLHRLDAPIPPEEARAYLPVDRRLLADGVRAHRGRQTPSPEHALVLEQLDWYKPSPQYTEGRLKPGDLANLEVLNAPPPPQAPAPSGGALEAMPDEIPPPVPVTSSGCGCASTAPSPALWGLIVLFGLVGRRFN